MKPEKSIPPKFARQVLLFFLRETLAEEVVGDLDEKFYVTLKTKSRLKAKLDYWYQVINYARPFAIRKLKLSYANSNAMFKSYFKIGWRNLFRNKGYSFINIGGLACGMAVAILIGLWVYDELSFNKYHNNYNRIARVMQQATVNGETCSGKHMPLPLGPELVKSYGSDFESSFTEEHILAHEDLKFTGES